MLKGSAILNYQIQISSAWVDTIGVRVVVERNEKTFNAKINALMNVWWKKRIYKRSSTYYSIWNYTRSVKVLLFMLANLSKFMNYCIYLSLLVDNSDDKIYNRKSIF